MLISKKLLRLRAQDYALIVAAYWWLLKAQWQMRNLRGDDWFFSKRWASKEKSQRNPEQNDVWIAKRVRWINFAARFPFLWAKCLQRSIALREWLAEESIPTLLRVGVLKDGTQLQAHAWLEYQGKVLNDYPLVNNIFTPFELDRCEKMYQLNASWEWTK